MNNELLSTIINRLMIDSVLINWYTGKQSRDFVFVGDVVDAILCAPVKGWGKGTIQIAPATETSSAERAKMIIRINGKSIPIQFDITKPVGDRTRYRNYDKAKQLISWEVFSRIEDGLVQTHEWACTQINKTASLLTIRKS